jgi:heme-degrading monooxygenase HmoA
MYMRISWGRVNLGEWDDYEAAFKEGIASAGHVPGLKGRFFARDLDEPDAGFSVSLWETVDAMEAYESGAAVTEVLPRIQPFFGGAFVTNRLEVVLTEEYE